MKVDFRHNSQTGWAVNDTNFQAFLGDFIVEVDGWYKDHTDFGLTLSCWCNYLDSNENEQIKVTSDPVNAFKWHVRTITPLKALSIELRGGNGDFTPEMLTITRCMSNGFDNTFPLNVIHLSGLEANLQFRLTGFLKMECIPNP